jgi:hypothetical protein
MTAHIVPIGMIFKCSEVTGMKADDPDWPISDDSSLRAKPLALTSGQTRCCIPRVFNHCYCRLKGQEAENLDFQCASPDASMPQASRGQI